MKASRKRKAKEDLISLKKLYKELLKSGWTLNQIDEMDIHFYLSLYNEETEKIYIDQIKLF